MQKLAVIVSVLLLSFASCSEQEINITSLEGEYTGIFLRSTPYAKFQPANVSLLFEGASFSGTSDIARYPAICRGTFGISGDEISFENTCFFTADFDWSLILSGTWKITSEGEEIVFRKKTGNLSDMYRLKKKTGDD
jgi:hypothetical protein